MRTTVPFIYNLGPHVEGLDVIDFPGADDDQKEIQDLVTFLYVLAQMFVFVVDYRSAGLNIHTLSCTMFEFLGLVIGIKCQLRRDIFCSKSA